MLGLFSQYVFVGRAQKCLYHDGPVILAYHRMGRPPKEAADPFLYVTRAELDRHLVQAKSVGLKMITLDEAVTGGELPSQSLVVTFDDGCVSVLEEAVPILKKHGVRAIQFIVADRIGGRNDWDLSKDDVPEP